MSLKKLTILMGLFFSTGAMADLSHYSSEELMEEVGKRIDNLGSGAGSGANDTFILSFSCSNHMLQVNMVSQNADANYPNNYNNDAAACNSLKTKLAQKYQANNRGFIVVEICSGHIQRNLKITAAEITLISTANHDSSSRCLAAIERN